MANPTTAQLNRIVWLMGEQYYYDPTVKKLIESLPKHNEKYTDPRADYWKMILQDTLTERATIEEASHIIKCLHEEVPHHRKKLIQIFRELKIIL